MRTGFLYWWEGTEAEQQKISLWIERHGDLVTSDAHRSLLLGIQHRTAVVRTFAYCIGPL